MCRDTFLQTRLLLAPFNLTLDICRDGAAIVSLGNSGTMCQDSAAAPHCSWNSTCLSVSPNLPDTRATNPAQRNPWEDERRAGSNQKPPTVQSQEVPLLRGSAGSPGSCFGLHPTDASSTCTLRLCPRPHSKSKKETEM